jgi:hypothetical protein
MSFYELIPQDSILLRYDLFFLLNAAFLDTCSEFTSPAAGLYLS